jgi:hypothetical protein
MAELADAADSKSADLRVMGVRPPLPAPSKHLRISRLIDNGAFRLGALCAAFSRIMVEIMVIRGGAIMHPRAL